MFGYLTVSVITDSAIKMGFRYGLELRFAVACFSPP